MTCARNKQLNVCGFFWTVLFPTRFMEAEDLNNNVRLKVIYHDLEMGDDAEFQKLGQR